MANRASPPPPPSTSRHPLLIGTAILIVIGLAAFVVVGINSESAPPQQAAAASAPATTTTGPASSTATTSAPSEPMPAADPSLPPAEKKAPARGPLPPLPMLGFAPPRPIDVVQAVFEFAARRPDVLEYVPCFCGCERSGHRGNDDCFVKSRDAQGNVEWEPHGMG
jgi:uncharacterized protein with PCYCGC motif